MKKKKKNQVKKLDVKSMSITEEQKRKLKSLFPEVFNQKKIDWKKLKTTLGEELIMSKNTTKTYGQDLYR